MKTGIVGVVLAMLMSTAVANADACDYRPSALLGGGGASATAAGGSAVAAAGIGAKAAGFYTLTHAVTGATMLGSAAGGASAAGTVGIMGGTAGAIGTVGAVLMAPATIVIAGTTAVGIGVYEGICYFNDERVTDYPTVLRLLGEVSESADPEFFRLVHGVEPFILVRNSKNEMDQYYVSNLYLVNGVLKHRDWFADTVVGNLGFVRTSRIE